MDAYLMQRLHGHRLSICSMPSINPATCAYRSYRRASMRTSNAVVSFRKKSSFDRGMPALSRPLPWSGGISSSNIESVLHTRQYQPTAQHSESAHNYDQPAMQCSWQQARLLSM